MRVRLRDHAQHALHRQPRFFHRVGAQQQHELVATQARGHVGPGGVRAQRAAQARGQLDQHAIAGGAAVALVDVLEVVEVDVADREQVALAFAGGQRFAEQLRQPRAVRQAREFVEMGLPFEPLALQALLGDVRHHQHAVAHGPVGIGHCEHAQVQRAGVAVAPALDDLAAPMPQAAQPAPDGTLLLPRDRVGGRGAEQRGHRAQQLIARDAGDAAVGGVDVEDAQLGIDDHQAFVQVLEQAARQALAVLGAALLLHVGQRGHQAQRAMLGIAFDHRDAQLEPRPGIAHANARLPPHRAVLRGIERLDRTPKIPAIVSMHAREPAFERGGAAAVEVAEQAAPARRGVRHAGTERPLGHADVGALQRQLVAPRGVVGAAGEHVHQQHQRLRGSQTGPQRSQTERGDQLGHRARRAGVHRRRQQRHHAERQRRQHQTTAQGEPGQRHHRQQRERQQVESAGNQRIDHHGQRQRHAEQQRGVADPALCRSRRAHPGARQAPAAPRRPAPAP